MDPPEGGFLGAIPAEFIMAARKYSPAPSMAHGQSLIWGGDEVGLQGVTELFKCERCDDAWLLEVQAELRAGKLSDDNYNFMHGQETLVPGSWVGDDVECNNRKCRALQQLALNRKPSGDKRLGRYIIQNEGTICQAERKSKALVAKHALDPRFSSPEFSKSIAIFANNDLKIRSK